MNHPVKAKSLSDLVLEVLPSFNSRGQETFHPTSRCKTPTLLSPSAAIGPVTRATALSATHPRAASQADDKRSGQLFGCANHYEQERYDELISMMCSTSSRSRIQAR